jgi:peptide deformylase
MSALPEFVVMDNPNDDRVGVLRISAPLSTFPLSQEDRDIIATLVAKYDESDNCAGLAAPQLGYSKRFIVIEVKDDPQLKKWRPDLVQTIPKSVWVNPSYEPIGDEKTTDYEACFSCSEMAGPVSRYTNIRYQAYTPEGDLIEGQAQGFLARLIQHEIDHVNGRLFTDLVPEGELLSIDEYRERRRAAMAAEAEQ